ncbi:MAG TPA: 16S rRNA (uracil(1498)-N(3))-methyltransferase [Parvularcula sp.]|nr:16S rRNA (uracil(1498)-N(3))-methyltransferase [Parvularcula sp.]HBS31993.1 16S rRNA (uracil(1498)-N(3))-methyltransferase [Parvularcula sp.]HBS35339.1 16S rRNA (uracil(1498)-N(3))-methyltransferase [Parvularcula sp.]
MTPRLHLDAPLSEGAGVSLSPEQAHYLKSVLRREAGAAIRVFNARDGEFDATLAEIGKKGALAAIGAQRRKPEKEPDIAVVFAPVKRAAVETIIQKATELGASYFMPVVTERANADRLRTNRLQAIALEAAEQCGRLSVPFVREPEKLPGALLRWDHARTLYFCDEAGDDPDEEWGGAHGRAEPLLAAIRRRGAGPAALLIGPEGGFSAQERSWLRSLPFIAPATLGPRILRADTAAIVSLALWQAGAGDLTCA